MSATTGPGRSHFQAWRFQIVYAVILVVAVALVSRVFRLQVLETAEWTQRAVDNYTRTISIPPPRGIIYDRNNVVLARNVGSYNVVITPASLPDDPADIQRIYREVSELIDVPVSAGTVEDAKLTSICTPGPGITQLVELGDSLAPYSPVRIKCNVDEEIARIIRERAVDWPGVNIEVEPIRDYPTGSLTANVIGFLGPIPAVLEADYEEAGFIANRDKVGYAGVELSLDDILIGQPGRRVVQVDVAEQVLRNLEPPIDPVPGNNIRLTIDTRLQSAADAALMRWVNFWNTYFGRVRISSGAVIAMNPKTGEVLAMVSYPTYENNRMARFIPFYYYEQLNEDPRRPLLNNAINGVYPPGSVFKLSTATGALNEGVVTLGQIVETPGFIELCERFSPNEPCTENNQRPFVDWIYERNGVLNPGGFGRLDFLHCIAYSSNVCFYKLGGGFEDEIPNGLEIWRLYEYARALGYDEPSGIELPGEDGGLIPTPRWKRITQGENWSTGDTYIASVGQGYVLATPLQVLMSGATIANDGRLMKPTILREVLDGEGRVIQSFEPVLRWDVTTDPLITDYTCSGGFCTATGDMKTIQPWVVQSVQEGMRLAVVEQLGTLHDVFLGYPIAVAGKTGTAEYCDDVAAAANRCQFGQWPTHAWTLAYAPYADPEIIVVALAYTGGDGGSVAAPIVADVIKAYFEIKAIDIGLALGGGG